MAVPVQSIVNSDSKILGFRSFIQGLSVNVIGCLYDPSLVGDPCSHLSGLKTICHSLSHSCR